MRLERHRGGAESVKSKIRHLASYARIAIHIGEFSRRLGKMAQRTRNKIASTASAALRVFPVTIRKHRQSRTWDPRVEES